MLGNTALHRPLERLRAADLRALRPRLALTVLGGACFAASLVLNVRANVGQGPWVAFHYGMTLWLPLSLGQANFTFSLVMIAIASRLGVPPGLGTALSMFVVSTMVDLLLPFVPPMHHWPEGYAMALVSVELMALGTALMVKAHLGIGPRDSFILAMSAITGRRVGLVKSVVELTALSLGFLMGAPVALGTVVYALTLGPSLEVWFRLFGLKSPKRRTGGS